MIRRPPRSTQGVSSAASDVYKRQSQGPSTEDFFAQADPDLLVNASMNDVGSTGPGLTVLL